MSEYIMIVLYMRSTLWIYNFHWKSITLNANNVDSNSRCQMGPLISKDRRQKVQSYIQGAVNDGAKLLYGGKVPRLDSKLEKGFFLEPTILGGMWTFVLVLIDHRWAFS